MPFTGLSIHKDLLKGIKELGFTRPTPIQEQAVPPGVAGRDIIASAMTGSGKTAAFLLPILHRVMDKPRGVTRALILTPTRELATQIHAHMEELAIHTPVTGASVFGGVGMGPQEHAFRSGADVIVATPGRLLDHMRRPYAKLAGLEILVLDEADRMLDMGFLPDIRRILRSLPRKRQTLLFSATMPREIQGLAQEMLHEPVTIAVERKLAPAAGITHALYPVARAAKPALLLELLRQNVIADVIVFTRTKHRADRLADYLERHKIAAARIHGNRSQSQRTAALAGFKAGRQRVLVATDIVSRGIDVESLGHVVNFDVPVDPHAYVHRVGRTARAEATGTAFTLVSPEEEPDVRAIEAALGQRIARVTLPGFDYTAKSEGPLSAPDRGRRQKQPGSRRTSQRGPGGGPPSRRHGGGGRGGGGPHSRSREERIQAILDKHAPVREAAGRRPASRWRR